MLCRFGNKCATFAEGHTDTADDVGASFDDDVEFIEWISGSLITIV